MTKKTAENATPKTALATAIETRDLAVSELARIDSTIATLERTFANKKAELDALTEQLGAADAAVLLGEGDQAAADTLAAQHRNAAEVGLKQVATMKALRKRREVVAAAVTEAQHAVAREIEAVAWPAWHEYSKEAVTYFSNFLNAVRRRLRLAVTVSEAFRIAGDSRDPFDSSSVTRAKMLGEYGLDVSGLEDLAIKAQLRVLSLRCACGKDHPPILGFLPSNAITLLPESELLALAVAAATEVAE